MKKNLGLILAGVALVFAIAAYVGNPVKETGDHVVAPAVGIGQGSNCPSSWKDVSTEGDDARVVSCQRLIEGVTWLVVLDDDGEFDHAIQLDTPGSDVIEDPSQVPGWR